MELSIEIKRNAKDITDFINKQKNMPLWTCHQTMIIKEGLFYEIRQSYLIQLKIITKRRADAYQVTYEWIKNNYQLLITIVVKKTNEQQSLVLIDLGEGKPPASLVSVLQAELRILRSLFEDHDYPQKNDDYQTINQYHHTVYTREIE